MAQHSTGREHAAPAERVSAATVTVQHDSRPNGRARWPEWVCSAEAAREEERRRIARELHDRVGHGIGLALQRLDLHGYYAERDPERARSTLSTTSEALQDALRDLRRVCAGLRTSTGFADLPSALDVYLRANVPQTVRVTTRLVGRVHGLPPQLGEELYLILREAVGNAVRHGNPTELRIAVSAGRRRVDASVTDNGRGFGPGTAAGNGLASMRERTHLLRGHLDVASAPGRGTWVTLWVPLTGGRP